MLLYSLGLIDTDFMICTVIYLTYVVRCTLRQSPCYLRKKCEKLLLYTLMNLESKKSRMI